MFTLGLGALGGLGANADGLGANADGLGANGGRAGPGRERTVNRNVYARHELDGHKPYRRVSLEVLLNVWMIYTCGLNFSHNCGGRWRWRCRMRRRMRRMRRWR